MLKTKILFYFTRLEKNRKDISKIILNTSLLVQQSDESNLYSNRLSILLKDFLLYKFAKFVILGFYKNNLITQQKF